MEGNEGKARLWKYAPILVLVLTAFLFMQLVSSIKEYRYIGGAGYPNTISVSGEGEVFAVPDVASFTFSVSYTGKTVGEAQDFVTERINKAIEKVKSFGIEDRDIKTLDYSAYPKYEYNQIVCVTYPCPPGRSELVGYEVNQTISVKVRDTDKAGEILGSLGSTGATNVSGLSFTIDDEETLKAEARKMAIEDAREKARQLSKDLKVKLVKIVSFSESGDYPIYYKSEMALGMGGDQALPESRPNLPTGENRIVSNVTIVYEIR